MQRNRKMTLNEEFALMRKMFHSMGITEVLKENKIRLNESLGSGLPSVLDGLTPGSSVALIGKTVLPEIENAILMSAKNSDLIMTQLGKKVGDNLTFDDIISSGLMGTTKREVAQNIVEDLGESGVTLMKNLGDIVGGANSSSLKNQIAELSTEPQRKVQSELQKIQKQIDVPDQATKAANLETVADLLPGLRNTVDGDISLTATQKTAINELFDSLEAQANAYKTKLNTDIVTPTNEFSPTIFRETALENFVDYPLLIKYINQFTDSQIQVTKNMLSDVTDDVAPEVLENVVNGIKRDTSITLYSGPGQAISDFLDALPGRLKRWSKGNRSAPGGCLNVLLCLFIVIGAVMLLRKCSKWDGRIKTPDWNPLNDSDDMTCVKEVPGFDQLVGDEPTWAAQKYGCRRTKNDNSDQKVIGFARSSGYVLVKTKDECVVSYEVLEGGLQANEISNTCGGNNVTPPPNNSCKCTLATMQATLDADGINYSNEAFDTTSCTGTYDETVTLEDGNTKVVNQTFECDK